MLARDAREERGAGNQQEPAWLMPAGNKQNNRPRRHLPRSGPEASNAAFDAAPGTECFDHMDVEHASLSTACTPCQATIYRSR